MRRGGSARADPPPLSPQASPPRRPAPRRPRTPAPARRRRWPGRGRAAGAARGADARRARRGRRGSRGPRPGWWPLGAVHRDARAGVGVLGDVGDRAGGVVDGQRRHGHGGQDAHRAQGGAAGDLLHELEPLGGHHAGDGHGAGLVRSELVRLGTVVAVAPGHVRVLDAVDGHAHHAAHARRVGRGGDIAGGGGEERGRPAAGQGLHVQGVDHDVGARAQAVARRSRLVGALAHGTGPRGSRLRDAVLRATPEALLQRQVGRAARWEDAPRRG